MIKKISDYDFENMTIENLKHLARKSTIISGPISPIQCMAIAELKRRGYYNK